MKNILVAIVAIIVLGGLYYFVMGDKNVEPIDTSTSDAIGENADMPIDTISGMRAEENAVVVTEQRPSNTVKVAQVYLAASGYVVIHEDNNGVAGAIIGSSALLKAGENNSITVSLTRATEDGETLWSMLHTETNGNTSFEATADIPVESRLGGPIMGWFLIDADAEENIQVTL